MLPFTESFLVWILSTTIPALVGVTLIFIVGRRASPRLVAAFALGIFFWFFVDTIEGSSDLDVSAGFAGGIGQVAMVALFIVGVLVFFGLDSRLFNEEGGAPTVGLAVPFLAALAIGFHGFGEGTAFGSTAALTSSASIMDAFGGVAAGAAYALHKMFEPMMVGALYVTWVGDNRGGAAARSKDILLLTLLFVLPSILGAATGYFISYDATYFFALGTGTAIYTAFRLAKQVFHVPSLPRTGEWLKVAAAVVLGFILIYLAALLHS